MIGTRLHYIPICLVLIFPFSLGICYVIALELGHINAFYTFISDAATLPPEQYVFAQLMNFAAGLFAFFCYIRYAQVEAFMKIRHDRGPNVTNVIALTFGFVTSLGISVVGNFPELYVKDVHLLGAFLAFIGCSFYTVLQGFFTFKMLPHFQSKFIAYFRIFLGILGLMLYFGAQASIIFAFQRLKNKEKLENTPSALKWATEDGGYDLRAASVIMEWLLIVIFETFIVTFIPEFKSFRVEEPQVRFLAVITELSAAEDQEEKGVEEDIEDRDNETVSQITNGNQVEIVMEGSSAPRVVFSKK